MDEREAASRERAKEALRQAHGQHAHGAAPAQHLDVKKVAAARLWAVQQQPYLASALLASPLVPDPGSGTVKVDRRWRLHVDPAVLDSWSAPDLGKLLVHHVGHLLRDHAARAREKGVGEEGAERWVRAADAEINDDLAEADLLAAGHDELPEAFGATSGRLAEEYYDLLTLREASDDGDDQGSAPAGDGDGEADGHECGSGSHGVGDEADDPADGDGDGIDDGAAELLRRAVAQEIKEHAARNPGSVPGGLQRWADHLLDPVVDWRRTLAAEVRRGMARAAGRTDYSFRRPARRQHALPDVVLPSLHRPIPEVAVIVDTSGSMGPAELERALGEVEGVLRATAGRGRVRVLAVDVEVQAVSRVRSAAEVRLGGGGGTDLRVGLAAAAALQPSPDLVVVVTDGHTPWPAEAPRRTSVVVALLDPGPTGPRPGTPPAWARRVTVPVGAEA